MFIETLNKEYVEKILNKVYYGQVKLLTNDNGIWKYDLKNEASFVCFVRVEGDGICAIQFKDEKISLAKGSKRYKDILQKEIDNNEYKICMYKLFGKEYADFLKENARRNREVSL